MGLIQVVVLALAVYFAGISLKSLFHKRHEKSEIMLVKRHTFVWLTTGITALAVAFAFNNISHTLGYYAYPSLADVFFALAYCSLAVGFNYFWYRSAKLHKLHAKEPVFIFGVVCGIFIWLYYLFRTSIIPASTGDGWARQVLNYYGPIMASVMFILTLVIHPRLKAGVIRTPLWYISSGVFVFFISAMMMYYERWNATYSFMPTVYSALFLVSSLYFLLGFYAAKKKYHVHPKR
jgi:uncharacterized membrane protein